MKFRIIAVITHLILSSSASANWFDGFNKASSFSNTYNLTANNTNMGDHGNGLNKGTINPNLGFGISFGVNENTSIKTISNVNTNARTMGQTIEENQTQASTSDMFAPLGFNPAYAPTTPPAMEVKQQVAKPPQDYIKLKAMWEAQRKQAEDMLKKIEEAQKSVASST
ncbi:MAG: hypothetical protein V3V19_09340 [Cocleimonas sp.]